MGGGGCPGGDGGAHGGAGGAAGGAGGAEGGGMGLCAQSCARGMSAREAAAARTPPMRTMKRRGRWRKSRPKVALERMVALLPMRERNCV